MFEAAAGGFEAAVVFEAAASAAAIVVFVAAAVIFVAIFGAMAPVFVALFLETCLLNLDSLCASCAYVEASHLS